MSLQEVEDKRKFKVKKQEDEVTKRIKKQKEETETKRRKDKEKLLEVQNYLRILVEKIPDERKIPQSCGAEMANLACNKSTFNDRVCFLQCGIMKEASEEHDERKVMNNRSGPTMDSEEETEGSR